MKYVIANWKMNIDSTGINAWLQSFLLLTQNNEKVIIAPPLSHLETVKRHGFEVAAQDIALYESGSFTGQTSITTVKEFCHYAIIGHTETQNTLEEKIQKRDLCLKHGITPILCFTELTEIAQLQAPKTILAWEDKLNISKDGKFSELNLPTITQFLAQAKGLITQDVPLLYGGSVNRQNAHELANIENVSGVLVGQASLDPVHFNDLLNIFQ